MWFKKRNLDEITSYRYFVSKQGMLDDRNQIAYSPPQSHTRDVYGLKLSSYAKETVHISQKFFHFYFYFCWSNPRLSFTYFYFGSFFFFLYIFFSFFLQVRILTVGFFPSLIISLYSLISVFFLNDFATFFFCSSIWNFCSVSHNSCFWPFFSDRISDYFLCDFFPYFFFLINLSSSVFVLLCVL